MSIQEEISVPFNNLSWEWHQIKAAFLPELDILCSNSHFCLGPAVEKFENEFAAYLDVPYAIGVNSGTSALHLALLAAGIRAGDKILVPAYTFIATISAILYVGATPVFCDIDEHTGTINIDDARKRITSDTKAIIPVHLYGQPANLQAINELAQEYQLVVIEDASQAHGATYANQKVGTFGLLGCFSFYAGKNLGALGEGGMIVTKNPDVALRLKALRHHGQYERNLHSEMGFNYRMEGIQGLALSHKLKYLELWNERRRKIARQYLQALSRLPIKLPLTTQGDHVYHLFVIRSKRRDELLEWLESKKIATGLHYPLPVHKQPCFKKQFDHELFPVADEYANFSLSLPIFAGMTNEQTDYVITTINNFFHSSQ